MSDFSVLEHQALNAMSGVLRSLLGSSALPPAEQTAASAQLDTADAAVAKAAANVSASVGASVTGLAPVIGADVIGAEGALEAGAVGIADAGIGAATTQIPLVGGMIANEADALANALLAKFGGMLENATAHLFGVKGFGPAAAGPAASVAVSTATAIQPTPSPQ